MSSTPGPWELIWHGNETYPYPLSIQTADGELWIARDGIVSSIDAARLIAAAPALLEALKWIADQYSPKDEALINQTARAAIASAKGDT